jgi:putative transcriptional regulator
VTRTRSKPKFKSRIAEAIHETMRGARRVGVIDKTTMREFDILCLSTVDTLSPADIRALRERERASQAVFASYLNVTTNLISKWERGQKRPSGPAMKLLSIVKAKGLEALA